MAAAPETELITDRHYFSYDIDKRYAENALLDGGSTAGEELKAYVNNLAGQIHTDLPRLDGYVHFRETYLHELCVIEKSLGSSHRVNRIKYIVPGLAPTAVLNIYDAPQTSRWTLGWIQACTYIDIRCIYTGGADEAVLVARASYRPFPDGLRMIHDGHARGYLNDETEAAPWTAKPVAIHVNTGAAMDVEVPLLGTEFRSPLIPLATRSGRQLEIVRHNQGFYTWLVAMRTDERGEKIYKVLHMFRWNTHLQLTLDGRLEKGYKANLTALHLLAPRTVTPIVNRLAWRELDYVIANHHRGTMQTLFEKLEWKRILTPHNRNCTVSEPKWKMTPCPSTPGDSQGHSVLVALESANVNQPPETIRYSVVSLAVVRGNPVEVSSLLNNVEMSCDSYIRLHAAVRLQSGNSACDAETLANWKVGWVQACYHSNLVRIYDDEHLVTGGRDGEMYRDNHPGYNEPKMWYNDANDWTASFYGTRTALQSNFDGVIEVTMEKKIMHRVEKTLQNSSKRLTALRIDAGYYSWLVAYNETTQHLVRLAVVQWPLHIAAYRDPSVRGNSEAWSLEDDGLRRTAWPLLAPLVPLPAEVVLCDPTHNPFFENDLSRFGTLGGADEHEAVVAATEVNSRPGASVRAKVVSGLVPVVAALVHSGFRPPMLTPAAGDHQTATAAASTQRPHPRWPPPAAPGPPSRGISPPGMAKAASAAQSSAPYPSPVSPEASSAERQDAALRSPARVGGAAAKAAAAAGARSPPKVHAALPGPLSPSALAKNGFPREPQVTTPPHTGAPAEAIPSSPTQNLTFQTLPMTPAAHYADSVSGESDTISNTPHSLNFEKIFGPEPSLRDYKPTTRSSWRSGASGWRDSDPPTEFDRGKILSTKFLPPVTSATKAADATPAPQTPSEPNIQSTSSKNEASEALKVSTSTLVSAATDKLAETSPAPKASSAQPMTNSMPSKVLSTHGKDEASGASKVTSSNIAKATNVAEETPSALKTTSMQPIVSPKLSKTSSSPGKDDALGSSKVTTAAAEKLSVPKSPSTQPMTSQTLSKALSAPEKSEDSVASNVTSTALTKTTTAIAAENALSLKTPSMQPMTSPNFPKTLSVFGNDDALGSSQLTTSHLPAAATTAAAESTLMPKTSLPQPMTPPELSKSPHVPIEDEAHGESRTPDTLAARIATAAKIPAWLKGRNLDRDWIMTPRFSSPPVAAFQAASASPLPQIPSVLNTKSDSKKDETFGELKVTSTVATGSAATAEAPSGHKASSTQPMTSPTLSKMPSIPGKDEALGALKVTTPALTTAAITAAVETSSVPKSPSTKPMTSLTLSETPFVPGKSEASATSKVTSPTLAKATDAVAAETLAALKMPSMQSTSPQWSKTPSSPGKDEALGASKVTTPTLAKATATAAAETPAVPKTSSTQPMTTPMPSVTSPTPGKGESSKASTVTSTVLNRAVTTAAAESPSALKTPSMQPLTSQMKTPVPEPHMSSSAMDEIAHPATSEVITSGTSTARTMAAPKMPSSLAPTSPPVTSPRSHTPAPAPLVKIGTASVAPGASKTAEVAAGAASMATASGTSALKQGASVSGTGAAAAGGVSPMPQRDVRKRAGPSGAPSPQPKAITAEANAEMVPRSAAATPAPQDPVSMVDWASDAALKFAEFQDERQPGETDVLRESIIVPVGQCLERNSLEEYLRKYGGRLPDVGLTHEPQLGILLRAVGITRLPSMNRQAPPSERTTSPPPRSETL